MFVSVTNRRYIEILLRIRENVFTIIIGVLTLERAFRSVAVVFERTKWVGGENGRHTARKTVDVNKILLMQRTRTVYTIF